MVDKLSELSDLSKKLNENSDKANAIILTLNKTLAAMKFGLEVWLENPALEYGDFQNVISGQIDKLPRQRLVTYLGYCNVVDGWQLATKRGWLVEDWDKDAGETFTEFTDVEYQPLLRMARHIRVKALSLVPRLLDELKREGESLLESIAEAETVANALTNDSKDSKDASAADYRIGPDGRIVTLLSKRAVSRGSGPKPKIGSSLAFKTTRDTAEFVRASEAEGFVFEGKEFLADSSSVEESVEGSLDIRWENYGDFRSTARYLLLFLRYKNFRSGAQQPKKIYGEAALLKYLGEIGFSASRTEELAAQLRESGSVSIPNVIMPAHHLQDYGK